MKKVILCLLLLVGSTQLIAQKKDTPTPEEVSKAKELKTAFEEEDLVIQSKTINIRFRKGSPSGKIGVIQTESTDYLNINSSFRAQHGIVYDGESRVSKFSVKNRRGKEVSALNLRSIKDEYLSSDDLFHTDYRVKYANLTFPLQGYRFIVETQQFYDDIKYFTSEYFSSQYRILNGTLSVEIPNWLDLEIKEFNFEGYDISKKEEPAPGGKLITYTFKEIEPRSEESMTPGPSFLYPHVLYIAKSYVQSNQKKELFQSVENLFGWYNGLVSKVAVDPSVFKPKVQELITNASTDEEKIKNIYYWVQDNIRYVAFEDGIAGFQPDSPQNVFTKKYGDCKGMAILTKSMLQEAGFDARLVWIGTDRLAYDYSIPSLSVDNHMICAVYKDGDYIFLDGTEKFNKYGEYASRIQSKQALIQDGDSYTILEVPTTYTQNTDLTHYNFEISDNTLIGTGNKVFDGESRVDFQNAYSSFGKENQEEALIGYLTAGNDNFEIPYVAPFDAENRENKLILSFETKIENAIADFDNTLYIDIDPTDNAGRWILEDRKVPLKLHTKEYLKTTIDLQIPKNHTVENLPESLEVYNDFLEVKVSYEQTPTQIKFSKSIRFKKRLITPEDFEVWNDTFRKLKDISEEQITLRLKD